MNELFSSDHNFPVLEERKWTDGDEFSLGKSADEKRKNFFAV